MQDRDAIGFGDAMRRAVLCGISVIVVVAAALAVSTLGWAAGLGTLGAGILVLVVILLAMVPDDDVGEGASDIIP